LRVIINTAKELLLSAVADESKIRLLGIAVSNFGEKANARKNVPGQLPLFDE
jgi:hypothetical protein